MSAPAVADWPTIDRAIQLGITIKRFPIALLREETARRRAKMEALGWSPGRMLEEDIADGLEAFQRQFPET